MNKRQYERSYFQVRFTDIEGKVKAWRYRTPAEASLKMSELLAQPGSAACTFYHEKVATETATLESLRNWHATSETEKPENDMSIRFVPAFGKRAS